RRRDGLGGAAARQVPARAGREIRRGAVAPPALRRQPGIPRLSPRAAGSRRFLVRAVAPLQRLAAARAAGADPAGGLGMHLPAAGAFALSPGTGTSLLPLPEVRLGIVMLCHDNLDLAARMVRIWTEGGAVVSIHVDRSAPADELVRMQAALADCPAVFAPRR